MKHSPVNKQTSLYLGIVMVFLLSACGSSNVPSQKENNINSISSWTNEYLKNLDSVY